jgi:diguanylate cyclase (GGDEF)-like protein
MISGLSWAPWSTVLFTAMTAAAWLASRASTSGHWSGWIHGAVLLASPWLLAAQQRRNAAYLKAMRQEESQQIMRLQEVARSLLSFQTTARSLETHIGQLTDVYHITKETSRALHMREMFALSLDILPRLLNAQGLRLIDGSGDSPQVLRATRSSDGRLLPEDDASAGGKETAQPLEIEQHLLAQALKISSPLNAATAQRTTGAACLNAQELGGRVPEGVTRIAWAPLWREQKAIGALAADNLPEAQATTLALIANQLSLQLSRVHLYQQVESLAVTDALTGLFVRRYFLARASEELLRATHHRLSCTLLMVDLDLFKQKNDTYGHLVGDVVLKDVAQLLKRNLREIDLIARFGGEEFILLLVETGLEQGMVIAERLRQLVEIHPVRAYDELLSQTISIGVAGFPRDAQDLEALIERSDQALYAAKQAGRNRVIQYRPDSSGVRHSP